MITKRMDEPVCAGIEDILWQHIIIHPWGE